MQGLKSLRRGRGLIKRAMRLRIRRKQPRYAGLALRSRYKAAPRRPRPTQPYLGRNADLAEILG
jgi:hypothetical protein